MFKQCTMCQHIWEDRDAYLSDPDIVMIGYQVNFADLQLGIFLFNHMTCQTTLAIEAAQFADLCDGPIYAQSKTGTDECDEHCLHQHDLDPCASHCECAWVRDIIQILCNWPAAEKPAQQANRAQGT